MSDPLPYSQWKQYRASNGLIYLFNPITRNTKWLWSRHRDPATSSDYLVNTVTGAREWVTNENQHLCPAIQTPSSTSAPTKPSPVSTNPFSGISKPTSVSPSLKPIQNPSFHEIEAPRNLALTADEILMLDRESGRKYIFNKKTKSRRWLPGAPPHNFTAKAQKNQFTPKSPQGAAPFAAFDVGNEQVGLKAAVGGKQSAAGMRRSVEERKGATGSTGKEETMGSDEAVRIIQKCFRGAWERSLDIDGKLKMLDKVLKDVSDMTSKGKYELGALRRSADGEGDLAEGLQRTLELGEYLTQKMLKLDDVESKGNELVRARRKRNVKLILGLSEEIDALRKKMQARNKR